MKREYSRRCWVRKKADQNHACQLEAQWTVGDDDVRLLLMERNVLPGNDSGDIESQDSVPPPRTAQYRQLSCLVVASFISDGRILQIHEMRQMCSG